MSKKLVLYRFLVVGVIVLFIGVGVQPAFADVSFKNIGSAGFIQSLINNASNGDTIYIPSGTYYEHIDIDKSIYLIGEDKYSTIIDGDGDGDIIQVFADFVEISNFTIQNGDCGILSTANFCKYFKNRVIYNYEGIQLYNSNVYEIGANNNEVFSNYIVNNWNYGIGIFNFDWTGTRKGSDNLIYNNYLHDNRLGIDIEFGKNNIVEGNIISDSTTNGMSIWADNSEIISNCFINNKCGIRVGEDSHDVIVKCNNFIGNEKNADFQSFFLGTFSKRWIRNYWDDWKGFGPKCIYGSLVILVKIIPPEVKLFPWIERDWFPKYKAYDIEVNL